MIQNTSVVFLPQVVAFVLHLLHLCTCCIYETFVVLKRQSKYSHSRPLFSHLCNICCIFATPVHYVRLSPFSGVSHKYPWGGSILPKFINIKAHSQIGVNLGKNSYLLEKF